MITLTIPARLVPAKTAIHAISASRSGTMVRRLCVYATSGALLSDSYIHQYGDLPIGRLYMRVTDGVFYALTTQEPLRVEFERVDAMLKWLDAHNDVRAYLDGVEVQDPKGAE